MNPLTEGNVSKAGHEWLERVNREGASKHTPGPWFRIPDRSTIWSDDRKSVAVCVMTTGDYEANANLIAAAPDLLEALEIMTNELAAYLYSDRSLHESEVPEIMSARKAIARAKGESS